MSSLRSTSRSKTDQDLSSLSLRRPSWTPSLSEYEGIRLVKSHSRRRARHEDSRSQEWNAIFPQSRCGHRSVPSLDEAVRRARRPRVVDTEGTPEQSKVSIDGLAFPESPEEGKRFRSWEINVKDLVGDAVGNMSISPTSRDISLAARRGLFIFDLESLDTIPRFLPQGGTWDVADVQWNPHLSHAQYIVSTSSEKLLIWNLRLGGKTSIQHVLKAHYRAITDINWHTTECDVVCSIGIDSWIWTWDIRTARKPIFGFSPFKAGGTQVKWNHKDGNILASAHADEVIIWDRRKGSLPVSRIQAHASKIYGIDWSRSRRDEIVTCSLDKTIKIWDTNSPGTEPKGVIRTAYPVWRARNLPFGEGILSLPQRGETTLELHANNETQNLVETFEGHTDVVKEFVWRKGLQDDFQLITWSKDRTLRFWPIDATVMEQVGYKPELKRGRSKLPRYETENMDTFSHPPEVVHRDYSAFSAPFLNRTILAEVRAPLPPKPVPHTPQPHQELGQPTPPTSDGEATDVTPTFTANNSINLAAASDAASRSVGGKMTKAGTALKSMAKVDQLMWLASVKEVSGKRGSSSGDGSCDGGESTSRLSSRSSGPERSQSALGPRQRSGSLSRFVEDRAKETDNNQSLHDEITTVLTRLAASKIKLEKYDLSKKRTCTLGLHSPLGERRSVFMRVTLTFPRDYPQAVYPNGTPTIELERNPLISLRRRDFILKHLRRIRERKRPCLEACLRFLLFADDGQINEDIADSETSSDEDQPAGKKKTKEITISLLRNSKNLTEPRTSQGSFGPNGELICFFRAAPRIVRHNIRGLTQEDKSDDNSPPPQEAETSSQSQKTSYFQSPALVADAVRRLSLAAADRTLQPVDARQHEMGMSIVRAMTNLLTLPQHKFQLESDSKQNFSYSPLRRSTVFLLSTRDLAGADKTAAEDYVFTGDSLAEVCEKNADAAKAHGRFDHERIFRTLRTLFRTPQKDGDKWRPEGFSSDALAKNVILKFYSEVAKEKDVQMLAIISMLVLQTEHRHVLPRSANTVAKKESNSAPLTSPRGSNVDYFSLKKPAALTSPISIAWARMPSPKLPLHAPSVSSSNSSRGSWSSLFNTGTVRQFMTGVQDSLKTPSEVPPRVTTPEIQITSPARITDSSASHSRRKRSRNNSTFIPTSAVSRSWSVASAASRKTTFPTSSTGHKRFPLRFVGPGPLIHEMRVVFEPPTFNEAAGPLFDAKQIEQFRMNVYYFAELLFRWQMYNKRLELLKAVTKQDISPFMRKEPHKIGIYRLCTRIGCQSLLPKRASTCQYCSTPCTMPLCTICRLPTKGLARTCVFCSHVTHVSCWNALEVTVPICPAGCGCFCSSTDGQLTRPSSQGRNEMLATVPIPWAVSANNH